MSEEPTPQETMEKVREILESINEPHHGYQTMEDYEVEYLIDTFPEIASLCESLYEENRIMREALEKIRTYDVPFEIDNTLFLDCIEIAAQALPPPPTNV